MPIPSLGLRARLALSLLILFIGLSGLIVWKSLVQREEYRRAAGERLLNDARLLAARQQAVMARGDAILNNAMLITALRDKESPGGCPRLFAERLPAEPVFFELGAAAADGSVLCVTPDAGNRGNLADRPWFQQAMATREMVISHVLDAPGPPRIMLGKALRDDTATVRAIFFLAIDLRRFEQELLKSDLPVEAHVAVIDTRGTVAVRFPDSEPQIGRHLSDHPLIRRLATEANEGVIADADLDGAPALLAFTPLLQAGPAPYQLVLSQPTASIEASAQRQLTANLVLALATLATILILIYLGSHYYLLQPIKALSHIARRVGAGDLAIATDQSRRDDEFAELWCSFEEMANALRLSTVSRDQLQLEMDKLKQAEKRLQHSQMTLSQATHIARLGVWSMELPDLDNVDNNPMQWSAEMYQLLDYGPADLPHPTVGHFFARVHPDDREEMRHIALAALTGKRPWQTEYRLILNDGSERLVQEVGEASFDPGGRPISILGATMDVTQQRRAKEILRDNRAKLSLALEGARAGSYEWNVETGATSWSDEMHTLCDLPDIDTTSFATWRKIIHPYDQERVDAIIETAVAQRTGFEVEWRLNALADAEPRWVMERASPVCDKDGKVLRYLGIIIDITKHKQAELSLKNYRELLEEMVQSRTAELVRAEAEQRRLNRALRVLGDCNIAVVRATSEQQLFDDICTRVVESGGYLAAWFSIVKPDMSIRLVACSGQASGHPDKGISRAENTAESCGLTGLAIGSGCLQVNQNCRYLRPRPDEDIQPDSKSTVALPIHSHGRVHGVLTLCAADKKAFGPEELALLEELAANISFGLQSLHSRNDLILHRQNLEQLVAERMREIGKLNIELAHRAEEAESANRAKSDFLATLSHEIRTPLNAVTGLSRLLADSLTDRRQRNYTDKIQNAAQVLSTLISDILDFSKIEAGSLQIEQAPFSLNTILEAAAAVVSAGIRGKDIEAFFDIAPGIPPTLIGDALRLQQILLNLCGNAIKFTERGTIVIAIRLLAGPAGQATLQFAVRDTGIGIPPEKLGRIFDVFTQADSSTSRQYGGSGLGLAISARLVDALGGHLSVDSEPEQGSEFSFTVTLDLPAEAPVPDAALPALRILVVDDHPLARDILQRTCAGFGWQATALDSAAACLAALQAGAIEGAGYDLLLLDWHMPDINGLDMLKLAGERSDIGLPLVVLMVPASELAQAVAAGDDLYLDGIVTKPLIPTALFAAVKQAYNGEPLQMPLLPGGEDRRLDGLRLLVAEDNELNQEMVEQILTRAGADVTLAANGQIAVDLLSAPDARFDAVLMDIQMPVMDGYEATRAIRDIAGRHALPIIAVTAHARPQDREKSLQAGMAGHIVKPVDVDDLLALLSGIQRIPHAPDNRLPPLPAADDLPGLDLAAIRRTALGRDPAAYVDLLRQFATHHGGDVERAHGLFGTGDRSGAIKLVHDLRGVAGYLKAGDLARLAAQVETALQGGVPEADALFEELGQAMATLRNSIARLESGLVRNSESPLQT